MIDGPSEAKSLEKTQRNKDLVRNFLEVILVEGHIEKLAGYFDGDHYFQHNPRVGDGLSGLGRALEAWAKQGITMKYDKIHKVLGEGSFVLTVSKRRDAGRQAFILLRPVPGRERQDSRALGHDRDHPYQGRVEELKREILIVLADDDSSLAREDESSMLAGLPDVCHRISVSNDPQN